MPARMVQEQASKKVQWVAVGRLLKPFGVRGEIRARIHTIEKEQILFYSSLWLGREDPPDQSQVLVSGRTHGDLLLLHFQGVGSPETARALTGLDLWVPRDQLPPLESGAFYWDDLLGLEVVTEEGTVLGTVESLIATGANDVITVRESQGSERLLPFTEEVVRWVDLENGTLTVRLMIGM